MKERVVKSEAIIDKISSLQDAATKLVEGETIKFINGINDTVALLSYRSYNKQRDSRELVREIKTFAIEATNREIERLEKELAEI